MAAALREPPVIERFGGGGFVVSGERHEGSILILADAVRPWAATELAPLTPEDFAPAFAHPEAVEFVLLGCGLRMAPPPKALRERFQAEQLGLEVMTTPEACRLYNVLAQDGRRIAAALLAV